MMERLVSLDSLLILPFLPFSSHPMPLTKRFVCHRILYCLGPSSVQFLLINTIIAKTTRY